MSIRITRRTALAGAAAFLALPSLAQSYPNRPLRLVVPFPAGGSTDVVGRIVAEKLSPLLGQPVVVENKAGAGGTIGSDGVAKAAPDGYTLLLGTSSTHAVAPTLYSKLGYEPVRDFAPVTLIGTATILVVTHPSLPARTIGELVAYAKANPQKISYGSTGNGSISHLVAEYFKTATGIQMQHIPYKGDTPLATDLLSGQVQIAFGTATAFLQHVQAGKLNALAITDAKPSPIAPNLPTVAATVPGFEALQWFGFFAPAGTPKEAVARLHADIGKVLQTREVADRLTGLGIAVAGGTPEQFAGFLRSEATKWAKIVKDSGAKVD
jgi:tripartite-type tricarboxylate transporter receptor subunit TctC